MHVPVLLHEAVAALDPKPGEFFIDGTLGAGGHAREVIRRVGPTGRFLGVDRDPRAVEAFKGGGATAPNVTVLSASYAKLPDLLVSHKFPKADGILLDLGTSSDQLDGSALGRGFSFKTDEPLLMTYDDDEPTVAQVLATISEPELTRVIRELGEERYAKRITSAIINARQESPVVTTGRLAEIVTGAVPASYERGRIHPATRTFQALRIYANHELEHLKLFLDSLPKILKTGGRVAIISFHSLEDRIVKQFFKSHMKEGGETFALKLLNKKPVTATEDEIKANPRSRSAKLRSAVLL